MITEKDYTYYKSKTLGIQTLCESHGISTHTAYRQLKAFQDPIGSPKRRWTDEQRLSLKAEMLAAIPHDREKGIKNVLEAHGLKSITQALSLLRVKSLSELRGADPSFTRILQRLSLRLVGDTLYSPKFAGRHHPSRQIILDRRKLDLRRLERCSMAFMVRIH
jgi:hypothetical protein